MFKLSAESHGDDLNGYNFMNKKIAAIRVSSSKAELKTSFYDNTTSMNDNQFGQSRMIGGALNGVSFVRLLIML
jgi:hypothetical protein